MPSDREARPHQINVRVTEEQADGLACIEFVDFTSGPDVMRKLLDAALTHYAELHPNVEGFAPFRTPTNEATEPKE